MSFRDYPGLRPGIVIAIVVGFVVCRRLGRAIGVSTLIACALVVGAGIIIAATLTPSAEALRFGSLGTGSCDVGRVIPASLDEILMLDETGLNVLMFVPLGLAVGLIPRSRTKVLLIAGSVALPFVIEGIQVAATWLDRACQSADVVDNLMGLVIGLVLGTVLGASLETLRGPDRIEDGPLSR